MNQKGNTQVLIIILVLLTLIGGGIYLYKNFKSPTSLNPPNLPNPSNPPDVSDFKDYSDQSLGFSFKYSKDLTVKGDSEEEFNKRGNGDFRKNFKGYVQYEPGKFLGAVVALDKSNSYDLNPFTVWVFDNSSGLTEEGWFEKYWYYPFLWGVFDDVSKGHVTPDKQATISGLMTKYKIVSYQPGPPKYFYLSNNGKMYLFRVIGESGDKVQSSFKFSQTGKVCAQVITPAKNIKTGECKEFGTPCSVPEGWESLLGQEVPAGCDQLGI